MSTHTFGFCGTISFWLGIVICGATLILAVWASMGLSDTNLNHGHDTYYILLNWKVRLGLLVPLVAGAILVGSGHQIRKQAADVNERLKILSENWKP